MDLITLFSTLDPVIQLSIIGGIGTYFGILIAEQSEKINTNIILYQGAIFLVAFMILPLFLNKILINNFEITFIFNILFLIILKCMSPSKVFTVYYLFLFAILITPSSLILNFEVAIEYIFIFFVWLLNLSMFAIHFGKNTFKKIKYDIHVNKKVEQKYLSRIEEDFIITADGIYINKSKILQMVPCPKEKKVSLIQETFNWIHNNAIWILFYATIFFYLAVIYLLISFLKI